MAVLHTTRFVDNFRYNQFVKMDKTVECKACEEQETGVYWA